MSKSVNSPVTVIGLDLGSSYVKAVALKADRTVLGRSLVKTGYSFSDASAHMLTQFNAQAPIVGVTGYGRDQVEAAACKTELSSLAMGLNHLGISQATLIDIGGQDSKILSSENEKLVDHALNRRCAAGTGSYLEFLSYRMNIDLEEMNRLAGLESGYHMMNSFCTVFAGTEILDCLKNKISLSKLIRGMYASVAERVREMAPLKPPVYLSGGVIAHHPLLKEVFETVTGVTVHLIPNPQYLAALGIAVHALDTLQ